MSQEERKRARSSKKAVRRKARREVRGTHTLSYGEAYCPRWMEMPEYAPRNAGGGVRGHK